MRSDWSLAWKVSHNTSSQDSQISHGRDFEQRMHIKALQATHLEWSSLQRPQCPQANWCELHLAGDRPGRLVGVATILESTTKTHYKKANISQIPILTGLGM